MQTAVTEFLRMLEDDRQLTTNTLVSYRRDLKLAVNYFQDQELSSWQEVDQYAVMGLLAQQKKAGKSAATINRLISSLRQFFKFMRRQHRLATNPMELIDRAKMTSHPQVPVILNEQEIEQLLTVPDTTTLLGVRDRAILEVLDATGMRVTELVNLQLSDLHLTMGLVQLQGKHHRERLIPMGRPAIHWLQRYLTDVRPLLVKKAGLTTVFVNAHGQQLTRQGLWKNFKQWVDQAGIKKNVTPQTLRYSLAVQLLRHGANSQVVQEILGYSELRMLQPYIKVTPRMLTENYEKYHPRA